MTLTHDYESTWRENPLQVLSIPTDEIIVVPELSGRSEFKRSKDKVKELTASIQAEGQIQPAVCGINSDEKYGEVGAPILYVGFGRLDACIAAAMPLLCMYSPKSIETVLETSHHENTKRENFTPVQVAANIKRMNEQGMNDREVAKRLGMSPANVSLHKRFLALGEDGKPKFSPYTLNLVHTGQVSAGAAYDLSDLPTSEKIDAKMGKLLDTAKSTGGKVSRADAKKEVREETKGKKSKKGKVITKGRSLKEVTEFIKTYDVAGVPATVRKTAQQMLAYIEGKADEKDVEKVLMKIAA